MNGLRPQPRTRRAAAGGIAPSLTPRGFKGFTVTRAAEAAREAKVTAVDDIIHGPHAVERPQLVTSLQAIVRRRRAATGSTVS